MKARLLESHEIAPEVRHFVFEVPEVQQLHFKPGQFVSLSEALGGKKITRAYSIVSMPDGNRFELCLNLVHEGVFQPAPLRHASGRHGGDGPAARFFHRPQSRSRRAVCGHRHRHRAVPSDGARLPDASGSQTTHAAFRRAPRKQHLLRRRFRRAGARILEFPILADAFASSGLLAGAARATCKRICWKPSASGATWTSTSAA